MRFSEKKKATSLSKFSFHKCGKFIYTLNDSKLVKSDSLLLSSLVTCFIAPMYTVVGFALHLSQLNPFDVIYYIFCKVRASFVFISPQFLTRDLATVTCKSEHFLLCVANRKQKVIKITISTCNLVI